MPEAIEVIPTVKKGMSKKAKNILIIVIIVVIIIAIVVTYLWYEKNQALKGLPTNATGLNVGDKWNNNGVLTTVVA